MGIRFVKIILYHTIHTLFATGKPHPPSVKDTKVVMLSGNYKQQLQKNTSPKENTSTNQQIDNSINMSPTSSLVNETKKMKIETESSNDPLTEDLAKPKTSTDESNISFLIFNSIYLFNHNIIVI